MSQKELILKHLRQHKSITPLEALKEYRCFRLAARIKDLRDSGHSILTTRQDSQTGSKFAEYRLI